MTRSRLQVRLRLILLGRDQEPHWDHGRFVEAVAPEKFLSQVLRTIGQQSDPKKIFLPRELDRMIEQFRTVTVSLELLMDH